jgi:hypothetical protein
MRLFGGRPQTTTFTFCNTSLPKCVRREHGLLTHLVCTTLDPQNCFHRHHSLLHRSYRLYVQSILYTNFKKTRQNNSHTF